MSSPAAFDVGERSFDSFGSPGFADEVLRAMEEAETNHYSKPAAAAAAAGGLTGAQDSPIRPDEDHEFGGTSFSQASEMLAAESVMLETDSDDEMLNAIPRVPHTDEGHTDSGGGGGLGVNVTDRSAGGGDYDVDEMLADELLVDELRVDDAESIVAAIMQGGGGHAAPADLPVPAASAPVPAAAARGGVGTRAGHDAGKRKAPGGVPESDSNSANAASGSASDLDLDIRRWVPSEHVANHYIEAGVTQLYRWQVEALCTGSAQEGESLIYTAPTSGGKTMVAEILMLRSYLRNKRKAIMVLPYVSIVSEKCKVRLQCHLSGS